MSAAAFGYKIGHGCLAYEVQQRFAKQINAKTKELDSGHLLMIAKPKELANWLIEIANLI